MAAGLHVQLCGTRLGTYRWQDMQRTKDGPGALGVHILYYEGSGRLHLQPSQSPNRCLVPIPAKLCIGRRAVSSKPPTKYVGEQLGGLERDVTPAKPQTLRSSVCAK